MYFSNHLALSQPDLVWPAVEWPPRAHGSGSRWAIGREAGAPHAAREELVAVALEDGSIKPKPWEPLHRWRLRVEVEIRESRAAQRQLRAPRVEAISVHR
jgi:hypothetical protein